MKFDALVFDPDRDAWLRFSSPREVLVARTTDQVPGVIHAIEAASARGLYAVGFVAFEAAGAFDPALAVHPAADIPLAMFALFDEPLVTEAPTGTDQLVLAPVITSAAHAEAVARVRHYLAEGDSYQVNLTYPMTGVYNGAVSALFASLSRAQPSDHALLIETDELSVCSVSPELFFNLEGETIRTEPMKGTRPRGRYPAEDLELARALHSSAKDQAENLMIVDMIRNDLGRVARAGSVRVDALFELRQLPTVWQLVSRVSAETRASLFEIFAALFPCASVTGAPKARSMAIIHELEAAPRGVYTGAVGLVEPGRKARFAVAIRTVTVTGAQATYGVGGGIVWDSDPAEEWQESLIKAAVLRHQSPDFELLETMRFDPGKGILLLESHLSRLEASARYFGFRLDLPEVRERLLQIDEAHPVRLRLIVSLDGSALIEQFPLPVADVQPGLRLALSPISSRDTFLFHKTTWRSVYDSAKAAVPDCDDVILFNERGELTETTISNLYLELDGELYTPALDSGLLAGTYRQFMLEAGRAKEATLLVEDLARATRVFVSNSVRCLNQARLLH